MQVCHFKNMLCGIPNDTKKSAIKDMRGTTTVKYQHLSSASVNFLSYLVWQTSNKQDRGRMKPNMSNHSSLFSYLSLFDRFISRIYIRNSLNYLFYQHSLTVTVYFYRKNQTEIIDIRLISCQIMRFFKWFW